MKKFLVVLVMLAALLAPALGQAADSGYVIDGYDVDIVVNEDNTYNVQERIGVDFSLPSHGIYRTMNLHPTMYAEHNGQEYVRSYDVRVADVDVDHPYERFTEGDLLYLQIGDADTYVEGSEEYNLSYLYAVGDDKITDFDQFYYGITGNEWDTEISGVTFRVTMPKEFDPSVIGFSVGPDGTYGYDESLLTYQVAGNVITGEYSGTLQPGEGIWIRVELPEGYYVYKTPMGVKVFLGVALGLLALAFLLFLGLREKRKPVQTVEFYPPEGMCSADVGYIIDGSVEDKDVVSLILYWAEHGYMEIHEGEKKGDITFKKIAELPAEADDFQTLMWNRMFAVSPEVKLDSLKYSFYDTLSAAKERVKAKYERKENLVFVPASKGRKSLFAFLSTLPLTVMAGVAAYQASYDVFMTVVAAVFTLLFAWMVASNFLRVTDMWQSEKRAKRTGSLIGWIIFCVIVYAVVTVLCVPAFGLMALLAPLCGILILLMAPGMRVRTDNGRVWNGRILGLKRFIEIAEADKLQAMVAEDPQYFYHVLPYAYVLGVSDKWARQFETIAVQPPTWYYGSGWTVFNTIYFTSMITRSMTVAQASMVARQQQSGGGYSGGGGFGGGGFSGGGFSGGGFGGGGGGRW